MLRGVLSFFEIQAAAAFDVKPEAALAFWRGKGLRPTFSYADMAAREHDTAFTVAKMLDIDLLKDVQESLEAALADGVPFREWADQIMPLMEAKGWWGRKGVRDPVTGQTIVSQLGSPGRLKTIFRTNLQSAYAAGQWVQIQDQAADAPYLMYDAVDDYRTREAHRALDGKVLPITDKFWRTHMPPLGYNCRCGVIQLSDDDLEEMGLEVSKSPRIKTEAWTNPRTGKTERVPVGVDPGFDHNPGMARETYIRQLLDQKVAALPDRLKDAANAGIAATAAEAAATAPAKPKRLTKAQQLEQMEERALQDLASVFVMPGSAAPEGVRDVLDAVEDTNQRFGMGKLRYLGDPTKGPIRYRLSQRASAAYAPSTDAMLFRSKSTNPKDAAKIQEQNEAYAKRKGWAATSELLRRAFGNEEAARIADSLPVGRPWTFNHSAKGIAYHEMGHRLHAFNRQQLDVILQAGYQKGWHHLVSEYGTTNRSEFMAEAFAIYMTGTPADMVRIYPPLLEWLRKNDRRKV